MSHVYHEGSRFWQDRFDTRRLADRIEERFFDGNGMYLSMGNALRNPHVGLLFVDFERQKRLRLNGIASIDEHDPLLPDYPEAQFIVRVQATEVFPNCPRYIHKLQLVERSRFVPKEACETPVPDWKRREWSRDVLATGDPARDASPL